MSKIIELKNASMAFELENGEILLISKEDIQEIASKLIVEMMLNKTNQVWMHKSTAIEKCNFLYKVIIDQKDKMTEEVRLNYFNTMLKLMKEDDKELITLEEEIKNQKESDKK